MKQTCRKLWNWFDDRTGIRGVFKATAGHIIPPKTGWKYVFGSATLIAFAIQLATGIALATKYVPSTSQAYETLLYITNQDPFGHVLRGLHYWGASAMVLFAGIHMIRVFLTGSYKFPREMNWISGVFLFVFMLGTSFTGQLLRWDQNAVWTAAVFAEQGGKVPFIGNTLAHLILGGETLGGQTLSHFFTLHVFVLPGLLISFLFVHLFLVIRNGISEPPRMGEPVDPKTYRAKYEQLLQEKGEPFWPNAAWRDMIFGSCVIIAIALLAIWIGPPALDLRPDPTIINAEPRPDWYFLWYFAVLALSPHELENYIIILGPAIAGIALLGLPLFFNKGERHPLRRPWSITIVLLTCLLISVLWLLGDKAPWSPRFDAHALTPEIVQAPNASVARGAQLFDVHGCLYCHAIAGHGGHRGPDLTYIGDRLTRPDIVIRIMNGGYNMPSYAPSLTGKELELIADFLVTRKKARLESAHTP